MYIRLTKGLADKGKLIPVNEDIYKHIKTDKDYYTSMFEYTEEHKKQFEETGSVAGMSGLTTNKLIFDFDSQEVEKAQADAKKLVQKLKGFNIPEDGINVYFSGKKGFHVEVHTKERFKSNELKTIAKELAKGLKTFDDVIYNDNRIIRIPHTKHNESGLYKTPLAIEELNNLSMDEIREIAKEDYEPEKPQIIDLPDRITALKGTVVEAQKTLVEESSLLTDIDLTKKPKWLSHWKYALTYGFFPNGQRSNALMIIAATYKSQGLPKEVTYRVLKGAAELQAKRFNCAKFDSDEIWENIIGQVYGQNWQGKTYSEDNFPQPIQDYLIKNGFPRRTEANEPVFTKTSDVFAVFKDFAENIDKNTITTGIESLDDKVQMTTGMLCGLVGAPSAGKTSISLEILRNNSLKGEDCAFFSMDMGANLVFQRLAQKVTGYDSKKLFHIFKEDQKDEIAKIRYKIDRDFKNVDFCFKTALTTEKIKEALINKQEATGKKTRLCVIDYLECISSGISDPTAKISEIAQELKDIAIELDICILLLLQPPKRVGDPSKKILSYTDIKGAATVGQACSIVMSLWREGFNPEKVEQDKYISFAALKNRMGQLCQIDCIFDGLKGDVYEMDDCDKEELEQIRTLKKKYEDDL